MHFQNGHDVGIGNDRLMWIGRLTSLFPYGILIQNDEEKY